MPAQNLDPLEQRVAALEGEVARLGRMTDTVATLRGDSAAIAETLDHNLRAYVAELDRRVERHGLLLGRLLDQHGDDT
jgi:hypothetical protein